MTILTWSQACSVFGIDPSKPIDADSVKQKYREFVLRWHPDKPGGDEARFKCVDEAYRILTKKLEPKGCRAEPRDFTETAREWSLETLMRDLKFFAERDIKDEETRTKFLAWTPNLTRLDHYPETHYIDYYGANNNQVGLNDYLENIVIAELQRPVWHPAPAEEEAFIQRYGDQATDIAMVWDWRFLGREYERRATWDEGPWSTRSGNEEIGLLRKSAMAYWKGGVDWKAREAEFGMIGRATGRYWSSTNECPLCESAARFRIRKPFSYTRRGFRDRNRQSSMRRYQQHLRDAHSIRYEESQERGKGRR